MNLSTKYQGFTSIFFIDSMVALECKPIDQLSWSDLDPVGPILIMVVPQVNAEIDKRKRDGRLQKRARFFNRLIAPAVDSGKPTKISNSEVDVYICVAECDRVDWTTFDDLDPEEGDHRVIAQVLKIKGIPENQKIFVSQDSNPLFIAARYGLRSKRLLDQWLLPPEPHPKEKELSALKKRISEIQASEPSLELTSNLRGTNDLLFKKIDPLTEKQRILLKNEILRNNPERHQNIGFSSFVNNFDNNYLNKYRKYASHSIPKYVNNFHISLEKVMSLREFSLNIKNSGNVSAQDLFLSVKLKGGSIKQSYDVSELIEPRAPTPVFDPIHDYISPLSPKQSALKIALFCQGVVAASPRHH